MPNSTPNSKPAKIWAADYPVTETLVRGLLDSQFPELTPLDLRLLGEGWDNTAYLVNSKLVVRFPRRKMALELLMNEAKLLPIIALHVQVAIPAPTLIGAPSVDYPCPFTGYQLIPGVTACSIELDDSKRSSLASPLGAFLRALHGIPVADEQRNTLPGDSIGRANMKKRLPIFEDRVKKLDANIRENGIDPNAILAFAHELSEALAHPGPTCFVHGDLYVRHLLLNEAFVLSGVIDWGDVHLGDPAVDLMIAYSFLPLSARAGFEAAYGAIDAHAKARAHFRALYYGAVLLEYGIDVGDTALQKAGIYAMRQIGTSD